MMAFSLKGLGKEGRASKSTKAEKMSKKMAKEEQLYKRKLSLSKVKVASSPSNSTPASSPTTTDRNSDHNAQGSILAESPKPVLVLPPVTSQSKPLPTVVPTLTPSSPIVASASSSAAASSSLSIRSPSLSAASHMLQRRNSRIQITPPNSINMHSSPRIRALASPLARRRSSLAPSSPGRPPARTQIKFSMQFLRMHNERKQRKAEEVERKKAADELQQKVLANITILEQRLAEVRKLKDGCQPGTENEELRIQAAQQLLQQLEVVPVPVADNTVKSKNNRMEEEAARRLKKKMASDIIAKEEAVNPGAGMLRDHEQFALLSQQEKVMERELARLRTQCVESHSRDAIMREEKLRREERKALRSLERRNSTSSPRLRLMLKPLPPVRNGLFLKGAEAEKAVAQQQVAPPTLTRMSRLEAEKARRQAAMQ